MWTAGSVSDSTTIVFSRAGGGDHWVYLTVEYHLSLSKIRSYFINNNLCNRLNIFMILQSTFLSPLEYFSHIFTFLNLSSFCTGFHCTLYIFNTFFTTLVLTLLHYTHHAFIISRDQSLPCLLVI